MTTDFDLVNATLAGRYRLERELGRGGMATVYLARDLRHSRWVAFKILSKELSTARGTARFQREIRLTARLNHSGILPLFDSGDVAGQLWYAMPYMEDGTLRERLRATGSLPVGEAVALMQEVLVALEHAHREGVIHRDLKPENILLSASGPVIADLGIARTFGGAAIASTTLTETGTALGTPEYMSPEQVTGGKVDGRSDLYAVATILYELMAGEPPYSGINAQAVIAKRLTEPVPQISILRPEVPRALEQVLTRGLAKASADRYRTAGELSAALGAAITGTSISEESSGPLRRRGLAWGAAAVVLALAVSGAVLLRSAGSETSSGRLDPQLVAVLPFTVTAPDSASNYLREGVVDLLGARLTGEGVPRAVDSRTLLARWRRIGGGRELTGDQALSLAQGLGAGQVLVGELLRTPERITIRGRLLRVANGTVAAEHNESAAAGVLDELGLIDRWVGRIFFVRAGEGTGRLANLSDSTEAVKAFLTARAAHNRGEFELAAANYQRALEIDSLFALAAFWLVRVNQWFIAPATDPVRKVWSLRDKLNRRDQALLAANAAVGPRYPARYTSAELIEAAHRAAELNPDRAEAFMQYGAYLLVQGAAAGVVDWLPRAVAVLDSAIKLDSANGDAVWSRLYAALIGGDGEEIHRIASLYSRTGSKGFMHDAMRWVAAYALHDSAALTAAGARFDEFTDRALFEVLNFAGVSGLPLQGVDSAVATWRTGPNERPSDHCSRIAALHWIAAMRGQVARTLALADSARRHPGCGARMRTINVALADPGYGDGPEAGAGDLRSQLPEPDADQLCHAEMWSVSRGDTIRTQRVIERLRRVPRNDITQPGGLGTCWRLLAAMVEALRPRAAQAPAPALERLDSLMRQGVFLDGPGVANILLARMLEARGDRARALAAVRRRVYNGGSSDLFPAYRREEGRLAALAGDTAGAIKAYEHYLTLRDHPDPGPMQEEVQRVEAQLAELRYGRVPVAERE